MAKGDSEGLGVSALKLERDRSWLRPFHPGNRTTEPPAFCKNGILNSSHEITDNHSQSIRPYGSPIFEAMNSKGDVLGPASDSSTTQVPLENHFKPNNCAPSANALEDPNPSPTATENRSPFKTFTRKLALSEKTDSLGDGKSSISRIFSSLNNAKTVDRLPLDSVDEPPCSSWTEDTIRKTAKQKKRLRQTFLDLGQKHFRAFLCPQCGLLFNKGVSEDEALHRYRHRRWIQIHRKEKRESGRKTAK